MEIKNDEKENDIGDDLRNIFDDENICFDINDNKSDNFSGDIKLPIKIEGKVIPTEQLRNGYPRVNIRDAYEAISKPTGSVDEIDVIYSEKENVYYISCGGRRFKTYKKIKENFRCCILGNDDGTWLNYDNDLDSKMAYAYSFAQGQDNKEYNIGTKIRHYGRMHNDFNELKEKGEVDGKYEDWIHNDFIYRNPLELSPKRIKKYCDLYSRLVKIKACDNKTSLDVIESKGFHSITRIENLLNDPNHISIIYKMCLYKNEYYNNKNNNSDDEIEDIFLKLPISKKDYDKVKDTEWSKIIKNLVRSTARGYSVLLNEGSLNNDVIIPMNVDLSDLNGLFKK